MNVIFAYLTFVFIVYLYWFGFDKVYFPDKWSEDPGIPMPSRIYRDVKDDDAADDMMFGVFAPACIYTKKLERLKERQYARVLLFISTFLIFAGEIMGGNA